MNSVGIDISKGRSTIAVMRPFGEVVISPFEVRHTDSEMSNVVYVDAASESNIPENVSEEIKEALVSYRTKTYKLNRIKAYEVFKNVSCDRIAKFAPTSLEELKALRCLDEAQITLYGQDIIEIVKQVLNK